MTLTAILTIAGIVITIAGGIARWWILRGAKKSGKLEERLAQKESAEEVRRDIDAMASKEEYETLKRIQNGAGDDGTDPDGVDEPWVRDRRKEGG
jgi:hypothetical protein